MTSPAESGPTGTRFGWTDYLPVSQLRADPSGVQGAGTTFQAILLPGMSTQTANVRYVSLFAAARLHRTRAGEQAASGVSWRDYLRRLEALIAVASVLHHEQSGEPPLGIIGRNHAGGLAEADIPTLDLKLAQPPYNIYRGSLAALRVMDISHSSDQLNESAIPLGEAWSVDATEPLKPYVLRGSLPASLPRDVIKDVAPAFCLCGVPEKSPEQLQLARWLLALDHPRPLPTYEPDSPGDDIAWRSVSWRLALELVRFLPGPALNAEQLMARILAPDLDAGAAPPPLSACLALWRWVAARAFFERGWTYTFDRALRLLRAFPEGLSPHALRTAMVERYVDLERDEPLRGVADESYVEWEDPKWLAERFAVSTPRDHVSLLCAGIHAADAGRTRGPGLLGDIWGRWAIPFEQEARRLRERLEAGVPSSTYWAEIAEVSLIEHLQSSLRKMRMGNPDSRLLDFDEGRWVIPQKSLALTHPYPSGGWSRLDQALSWARQLGLLQEDGEGWHLTPLGAHLCDEWDEVHSA